MFNWLGITKNIYGVTKDSRDLQKPTPPPPPSTPRPTLRTTSTHSELRRVTLNFIVVVTDIGRLRQNSPSSSSLTYPASRPLSTPLPPRSCPLSITITTPFQPRRHPTLSTFFSLFFFDQQLIRQAFDNFTQKTSLAQMFQVGTKMLAITGAYPHDWETRTSISFVAYIP